VTGQNTPAHVHKLGRHLSGPNPVTQYWVDRHTTIFKVDVTAEGEGGCGGDAHLKIYLTLHTDGTTGTATAPGVITVETDVSARGDLCGELLNGIVSALTGHDVVADKVRDIKRQIDALAEDRQAPASPVPLNLLICCNGNIEVNCCSGDNSACDARPEVNYSDYLPEPWFMDPHLPPPSTERPLLCSSLTQ
jgi:hypothetical protein